MKKSVISIIIPITFLLFTKNSFSQTIFESHFSQQTGYSVKELADGYVIAGTSTESMMLVRTDLSGNMVWEKMFGDLSGIHPEHAGFDVLVMPDSGFLVVGRGMPFNQNSFAYFIRTDPSGNVIWESKIYSDVDSLFDDFYAKKAYLTTDGKIIAAGVYSDYNSVQHPIVIELDTLGNLFRRTHINLGYKLLLTDFIYTDSAYYFLGNTSGTPTLFNITKTDTNYNVLSTITYGNGYGIENAYSFTLDPNGNLFVSGLSELFPADSFFVNKYSASGDTLFTHSYTASPGWNVPYPTKLIYNNGTLIIAGYESYNSPDEAFLAALDTNGNELYRYHYGGSNHDEFFDLIMTSDSNLVAIGRTSSFSNPLEMYLVKVNPSLLLTVHKYSNESPFEISFELNSININLNEELKTGNNYWKLYDITGKMTATSAISSRHFSIYSASLHGLYLLNINANNFAVTRKIYFP